MAQTIMAGLGRTPGRRFVAYVRRYWFIYALALPGIAFMAAFSYAPMYGLLLAFKKLNMGMGIWRSPWADPLFKNFELFFNDPNILRAVGNTVIINVYNLIFGFTFVIFLALMLNELRIGWLKRATQTFVYLPYFISWVVFAGIVTAFLSIDRGLVNGLISALGGTPINFLNEKQYFRGILVVTNMIKSSGYNTIIYLAAIAGVNVELYESAKIDGANRYHMMRHITLPRIYPTIAVLLILQLASIFSANFDQVFNLYSPLTYETGDVISTYIYRVTLGSKTGPQYETATVMGLVFNVISFTIIIVANKLISRMDVMGIF